MRKMFNAIVAKGAKGLKDKEINARGAKVARGARA